MLLSGHLYEPSCQVSTVVLEFIFRDAIIYELCECTYNHTNSSLELLEVQDSATLLLGMGVNRGPWWRTARGDAGNVLLLMGSNETAACIFVGMLQQNIDVAEDMLVHVQMLRSPTLICLLRLVLSRSPFLTIRF